MRSLSTEEIEKLKTFNNCFIEHPQIKQIYNDFDSLREARLFQSDPKCMLLTGDTGVGKSHLINHYKNKTFSSEGKSPERVPVLISRISSTRGLANTLMQILSDLDQFGSNYRQYNTGDSDLAKQVVKVLKRANVELLIINEFQELIEFKTVQERQTIANSLKYISEEARISIVLVGMPWAEQIADEPQWSSRLIIRRDLEYFSLAKERDYYLRYLMSLAQHMPFDSPPSLHDAHTAVALFSASRGENRALKTLLSEAIKVSFFNNKKTLGGGCFTQAHNNIFGKTQKNPFVQDIFDIEISEMIESSKYNPRAMCANDMLVPRKFSEPIRFKDM
ncbi:TniB family NTP-binding protein [Thalassotalea ganghwensis]